VPDFKAGFPAITNRSEGCTQENIGDANALKYLRENAIRNIDSRFELFIGRLSSCPGNSGGTLMDRQACVLYGVFSGSYGQCDEVANAVFFFRIVGTAAENEVHFLSLAAGLVEG